jgi:hypothetical protein
MHGIVYPLLLFKTAFIIVVLMLCRGMILMRLCGNIFEKMRAHFDFPASLSFSEYVTVDDEVAVAGLITEEDIVRNICQVGDHELIEIEDDEDAEINPPSALRKKQLFRRKNRLL